VKAPTLSLVYFESSKEKEGKHRLSAWCGAYIDDEDIGYRRCKEPISLMREAYIFDAKSVYL
jgi:hypothetical protein